MADKKISELIEDTSPSTDDLIVTVNDPGGTSTNRKVTIGNLYKAYRRKYSTFVANSNTNITSLVNEVVRVDTTSGPVTLTVSDYSTKAMGDKISVVDVGGNSLANNITINWDSFVSSNPNTSIAGELDNTAIIAANYAFASFSLLEKANGDYVWILDTAVTTT